MCGSLCIVCWLLCIVALIVCCVVLYLLVVCCPSLRVGVLSVVFSLLFVVVCVCIDVPLSLRVASELLLVASCTLCDDRCALCVVPVICLLSVDVVL